MAVGERCLLLSWWKSSEGGVKIWWESSERVIGELLESYGKEIGEQWEKIWRVGGD